MKNAKISIIVPIYKVEKELDRCVQSLLNQTYKNIEIILVDDGSPDNCPKICDDYAGTDSRVKVIHQENSGLSEARNAGLKFATGEYVLYVDSDDYIELDACEKLIEGFIDDEVDFVAGNFVKHENGRITIYRHSNIESCKKISAREFAILSIKKNEWYAPACINLYRKKFLVSNNLFFVKGRIFEDMEMLPRLFDCAEFITYMDENFYHYIIRQNSIMTSQKGSSQEQDALANYIDWKKSFDKIEDKKLQRYLYGVLVKYYLKTCRDFSISSWKVEGLNLSFAMKYALDFKEIMKIIGFELFPKLFLKL